MAASSSKPPPAFCRFIWFLTLSTLLITSVKFCLRSRQAVVFQLSNSKPTIKYELGQCVPPAARRYDAGGKFGFVFSATDRYATGLSYRCVAAIESLVRIGGWSGPVYLMVNKGRECLDQEHLRRVTGNSNVHVVHDFYGVLRAMPDVYPGLPRSFNPGSAKSAKGAMLDIVTKLHARAIPGHSVGNLSQPLGPPPDVLIYHDCDKVVARTGCIEEMLRVPLVYGPAARMYTSHMEPQCIRATLGGKGPCGDNLHAGVVALHREWSLPIGRAWAHAQLVNGKRYDRHTLWDTWNSSREPDGSPSWPMVSLPPLYQDFMWDASKPPSCINHVSGGRCKAAGQKRARAFMRSLCLHAEPPAECAHRSTTDEWCGWNKPS